MGAPQTGEDTVIDRLLELAVHTNMASEAVVEAAEQLTVLRPEDPGSAAADAWSQVMDGLMALNVQLGCMERVLRSIMRESAPPPMRASGSH